MYATFRMPSKHPRSSTRESRRNASALRCAARWPALLLGFLVLSFRPCDAAAQQLAELQADVADLFGRSCARVGCHAGSDPQMGMSLEEDLFVPHTVSQPSRERPELNLVEPGRPDSSYLVMKVTNHPDIIGARMPMTGNPLSESEVGLIEDWVRALEDAAPSTLTAARKTTNAFDGWKVVNLPTTRMVDQKTWLFLIGHRFNPELSAGYGAFYGLDGSSIIFLSMGYAPTSNLLFVLGRSNAADNVELQGKYRFLQQTLDDSRPVSAAAHAAINWVTEEMPEADRLSADAFKVSGQIIVSREMSRGIGLLVAPGILFNPAEREPDEGPLVTIGLGGRWRFHQNLSFVAEWVPILTGYTRTATFGNDNRFDSWGGGLEIAVGGHIFQIVLTNSVGLTTDQYLRGGDLDIRDPDLRLGFNIFRLLRF